MHPSFDLHGKRILIVGACSAMGQAIAEMLWAHHANLILVDLHLAQLASLTQKLAAPVKAGQSMAHYASRLDSAAQRQQLIDALFAAGGGIDGLVYVAGIQGPANGSVDFSEEDFAQVMNINVNAPRHLSQLLLPQMQQQRAGSLIFIASIAALRGNRQIGLYGLSKAALCQMARNLAVQFGPDNIRANCILPGLIETPFAQSLIANPAFMATRLAKTPLRRVGQPNEVAGAALLLLSDAGGFITGQSLIVDGGTTISD
jgi:NAD(P)-dependent dehydrogenase (short-subunit alcohol dehydrogenase family)